MKLLFETKLPEVICFTETWLSNEFPDDHLDLNDFILFRKDRDNSNDAYGGVLIAVKSKMKSNAISIGTYSVVIYFRN